MTELIIRESHHARWGSVRRPNIKFFYKIKNRVVGRAILWTNFDMSHVGGPVDAYYFQDLAVESV